MRKLIQLRGVTLDPTARRLGACYDVSERAWLKHFLDGWLSRVPDVTMAEAAE